MLQISAFFALFIASALGAGEVTILHHPSSLVFKGHEHLRESILPEVYAASLGFTTEHNSNWAGLYINDPFDLAEAIVTISVDGVTSTGLQKGHHYPMRTNEEAGEIYHELEKRIQARYPEASSQLVNVDLSRGLEDLQDYDAFKAIKNDKPKKTVHNYLKLSAEEDREFLIQLALLNAVADQIEQGVVKRDFVPDAFFFKVTGLHAICDLYGDNSTSAKEAKHLLNEAIARINTAFSKAYKGYVLVNVVASDASHTRRARSILEADEQDDKTKYNLASHYDETFPVMFNIILWFGVIMFFALLAICLAIADMDPGRDSIIYRMTSTRIKKDN